MFWQHVDRKSPKDCWEWTAFTDYDGYGQVRVNGKTQRAHRIAYLISKGRFDSNLLVCHSCDNKKCCNPDHLFLGTHIHNVRDAMQKGKYRWNGAGFCRKLI